MYVLQNYNELVDEADIKVIKANSQRLSLNTDISTELSKRNGAKLRESFFPTAASHSRPRQAGD